MIYLVDIQETIIYHLNKCSVYTPKIYIDIYVYVILWNFFCTMHICFLSLYINLHVYTVHPMDSETAWTLRILMTIMMITTIITIKMSSGPD